MSRQIIFVCTGNTCRSPLAESYAKTIFKDRLFASRGLMVTENMVNPETMKIIDNENLMQPEDPEQLTAEDAENSILLAMTKEHEVIIKNHYPEAEVHLLSEYANGTRKSISDPIGGTDDDYRNVYSQLQKFIGRLFK